MSRLALGYLGTPVDGIPNLDQLPMRARENRIALRNAGHIDPYDMNSITLRRQDAARVSGSLGWRSGSVEAARHWIQPVFLIEKRGAAVEPLEPLVGVVGKRGVRQEPGLELGLQLRVLG